MSFEIEGTLHKKFDTENKTDSFQAREFVLQVQDGNYPQYIKFQLTQDRCALVDPYNEGDLMKVHFDLRGREWNEKYFTNLNAWRVEKPQANTESPAAPAANTGSGASDFPTASDEPPAGDFDDLPF
ncbi:MAG: DUF3127 domain-containing protein [Saprospiraceae bacterium]|nr:DUF3127 domain-containing protein [Saprospiraceae bacterium]